MTDLAHEDDISTVDESQCAQQNAWRHDQEERSTRDDRQATEKAEENAHDPYRMYGRRLSPHLHHNDQRRLTELLPHYALNIHDALSAHKEVHPAVFFSRHKDPIKDIFLEVGSGGGEFLTHMAQMHPNNGYVGCEPYLKGVAQTLRYIEMHALQNVRLSLCNALYILEHFCARSLSGLYILFPDPWPKKRHHKRRFINTGMLDVAARVLKKGAHIGIACDVEDYINQIEESMYTHSCFKRVNNNSFQAPEDWLKTRYWQKAEKERRIPQFFIFSNNHD